MDLKMEDLKCQTSINYDKMLYKLNALDIINDVEGYL